MSASKPDSDKATTGSVDGNEITSQTSTAKSASEKPKLPPYRLDLILASYALPSTILHNDERTSEATLISAAKARMAMILDALDKMLNGSGKGKNETESS